MLYVVIFNYLNKSKDSFELLGLEKKICMCQTNYKLRRLGDHAAEQQHRRQSCGKIEQCLLSQSPPGLQAQAWTSLAEADCQQGEHSLATLNPVRSVSSMLHAQQCTSNFLGSRVLRP